MPELVMVSNVQEQQQLKPFISDLFRTGRYAEITQAVGMHSILIKSEHMIGVQNDLYRFVLSLIKERIVGAKGKSYAEWYEHFPKTLDALITSNAIVVDKSAADEIASHRAAYGSFKSLDDFFFWALDDRRLSLAQIVKYIDRTLGTAAC